MQAYADYIVYGGARGGGKTYSVSGNKSICHVREWLSEDEIVAIPQANISEYRVAERNGNRYYYKISIDYPHYRCVIVRHTEDELIATVKNECDKTFPQFGGRFNKSEMKYVFPSGAEVYLRHCERETALSFFKSGNFHTLIIEELTEFKEDWVEQMEGCVRTGDPLLPTMKIYTTNPGGIGHSWVKKKFIDPCKPVPDGDKVKIFVDDLEIIYQPLKPNKPGKTKTGESIIFIPSLIFDNPYIMENDKTYIRNLMAKNDVLKRMWLFGDWDVFAGQFFDFLDYQIHVIPEHEFFGAKEHDREDLIRQRLNFDWRPYRLFRSYDYGYGEMSAWACGAYALNRVNGDIIKFAEIIQPKLTASMQAKRTNQYFKDTYNLLPEHFEREFADPKSYWANGDRGSEFRMPFDEYKEQGIILQPAKNERQTGAMAMLEALHPAKRDNGIPRQRFLSNCWQSWESLVNLPIDPKNPNDVDTRAFDHPYDENRYFVVGVNELFSPPKELPVKTWREEMQSVYENEIEITSWKVS